MGAEGRIFLNDGSGNLNFSELQTIDGAGQYHLLILTKIKT